jgi:hypothetical protein
MSVDILERMMTATALPGRALRLARLARKEAPENEPFLTAAISNW